MVSKPPKTQHPKHQHHHYHYLARLLILVPLFNVPRCTFSWPTATRLLFGLVGVSTTSSSSSSSAMPSSSVNATVFAILLGREGRASTYVPSSSSSLCLLLVALRVDSAGGGSEDGDFGGRPALRFVLGDVAAGTSTWLSC